MTKFSTGKSLVLYADDDADDRDLIKDAFSGYSSIIDLITFSEGEELLRYMKDLALMQAKPCLVILDINMPKLNGKQTLQMIREMNGHHDVPVVLFTTSTLPSEIAFARNNKAGFVTKPIHSQQIHFIIQELMEHCADDVKEKIKNQREN